MSHPLTSQPLRIDAVYAPTMPGLIGMTLCPGRKEPYASFGAWDRDLPSDLQAIRAVRRVRRGTGETFRQELSALQLAHGPAEASYFLSGTPKPSSDPSAK